MKSDIARVQHKRVPVICALGMAALALLPNTWAQKPPASPPNAPPAAQVQGSTPGMAPPGAATTPPPVSYTHLTLPTILRV